MKKNILIYLMYLVGFFFTTFLTSCNKDDDTTTTQSEDNSQSNEIDNTNYELQDFQFTYLPPDNLPINKSEDYFEGPSPSLAKNVSDANTKAFNDQIHAYLKTFKRQGVSRKRYRTAELSSENNQSVTIDYFPESSNNCIALNFDIKDYKSGKYVWNTNLKKFEYDSEITDVSSYVILEFPYSLMQNEFELPDNTLTRLYVNKHKGYIGADKYGCWLEAGSPEYGLSQEIEAGLYRGDTRINSLKVSLPLGNQLGKVDTTIVTIGDYTYTFFGQFYNDNNELVKNFKTIYKKDQNNNDSMFYQYINISRGIENKNDTVINKLDYELKYADYVLKGSIAFVALGNFSDPNDTRTPFGDYKFYYKNLYTPSGELIATFVDSEYILDENGELVTLEQKVPEITEVIILERDIKQYLWYSYLMGQFYNSVN